MNVMLYGLAGVGVLASAVVLLWVAIFAWGAASDYWGDRHNNAFQEGVAQAKRNLKQDAWWLSEDERTMLLVMDIAEVGIEKARERWRATKPRGNPETPAGWAGRVSGQVDELPPGGPEGGDPQAKQQVQG